jgi:hypothetical protein
MGYTADFEESVTLVAVTRMAGTVPLDAGAVYNPLLEIVPTKGVSVQVTAWLLEPATVAVNWFVCPGAICVLAEVSATDTGLAGAGQPNGSLLSSIPGGRGP